MADCDNNGEARPLSGIAFCILQATKGGKTWERGYSMCIPESLILLRYATVVLPNTMIFGNQASPGNVTLCDLKYGMRITAISSMV